MSITEEDNLFLAEFRLVEPKYQVIVHGTGMYVTVTRTGFVASVTVHENVVNIVYAEKMISKEEARAILQEQPILQLGIAPELNWQYVYKQNFDLYGIDPDGKVRFWSEDEAMQDAGFEPLPQVEAIEDFEAFLKGSRNVTIEAFESEEEKRWAMETDEHVPLPEKAFIRACQVVKYLAGDAYGNYYIEQYPTLRKLLHMDEHAFVTFRFVYIYENISFDFQAIAISMNTETNQIESVRYPIIPYETFPTLRKPTLTVEQANHIAKQLIDVELTLESDLEDRQKRSFVYMTDYPTSPTGCHIQYVDAFTGEIHWIDNL